MAAVLVPIRRSKSVTLRSTEAARAVSVEVDGSARARNGFSETVCESGRGECQN